MLATWGAHEGMSNTRLTSESELMPSARPKRASPMGSPIAITEPNASRRMTIAAMTPTISPVPAADSSNVKYSSPPDSSRSGVRSRTCATTRLSSSRSAAEIDSAVGYCSRMSATRPSGDTASPVATTFGIAVRADRTSASCAFAAAEPVKVAPSASGVTTTWAVMPPRSDPVDARRSTAACESSPGTSNESCIWRPTVADARTTRTDITSHAPMTAHGRRAAKRPNRYNDLDMECSSAATCVSVQHRLDPMLVRHATDRISRGGPTFLRLPGETALVLVADQRGDRCTYAEGVLSRGLRSLWQEPRAPGAPARVWRDWVLVGVLVPIALLEGILRPDVVWRPFAVVLSLAVIAALLWRRTHPFAVVALVFGAMVVVTVAAGITGTEPVGLYSAACVLLLPYALMRWGSGREIVIGMTLVVAVGALGIAASYTGVGDAVGAAVVFLFPPVLGASVRVWATARDREMEQARMREREQLARELHDTVAHHVSAMVIQAQAGRVLADSRPDAAVEALRVIESEASSALKEMRTMVGVLRDGEAAELVPQRGRARHRAVGGRLRRRAACRRRDLRRPRRPAARGGCRDVPAGAGVRHERDPARASRDPYRGPGPRRRRQRPAHRHRRRRPDPRRARAVGVRPRGHERALHPARRHVRSGSGRAWGLDRRRRIAAGRVLPHDDPRARRRRPGAGAHRPGA